MRALVLQKPFVFGKQSILISCLLYTSINDALTQENAEIRRVYFDCIGVQRLFTELQPVLRDRQVIKKKRTKWDDNNDQTEYEFEDVYELYEIEGTKLFSVDRWGNKPNPVYAVRCWCTTTNREYWLYVSPESATGSRWAWSSDHMNHKYDAIRAIAWTIRIDIPEESVDRIYRQGDIIVVKSKVGQPVSVGQQYHISKEMYLSSMYSET